MLNFIVLGIVPGTSFTVTLWWVLLVSFVLSAYVLVKYESAKSKKVTSRTRSVVNLDLINPSF